MRFCGDYYAEIGWDRPEPPKGISPEYVLSHSCCISCHEDADSGYSPLCEIDEGNQVVGMVCCTVSIALDERGK